MNSNQLGSAKVNFPDGTWSHKPASFSVTNLDSNNQIIYDPQTAAREIIAR